MTQYRVIFDDPDALDEPTKVLVPSDRWMKEAMEGNLPPISVYWELQDDEQKAIAEGRHSQFQHDPEKLAAQYTAPRIGPLTEQEALEYLIMKDLPRKCWAEEHNRPMFKIVRTEEVPSDRQFRNAWEMAA
tara:strand:- start:2693 stop:3085 length:393 start_codon:yes stop_codon:yes gene_type:complete